LQQCNKKDNPNQLVKKQDREMTRKNGYAHFLTGLGRTTTGCVKKMRFYFLAMFLFDGIAEAQSLQAAVQKAPSNNGSNAYCVSNKPGCE
jgi:hypothetical protein